MRCLNYIIQFLIHLTIKKTYKQRSDDFFIYLDKQLKDQIIKRRWPYYLKQITLSPFVNENEK